MTRIGHAAWRHFESCTDDSIVLAMDPNGCILSGTSLGLMRFDGRTSQSYGRRHGLWPDSTVTAILVAPDSRIWVGTATGTVAWWDGSRFRIPRATTERSSPIDTMLQESEGTLLIGCGEGLYRMTVDQIRLVTTTHVRCMLRDRRGYIWVGTPSGLCRLQENVLVPIDPMLGLSGIDIAALAEDQSSNLWVAGPGLVAKFDGQSVSKFTADSGIPRARISTLAVDSRGLVWFGTIFSGAGYMDEGKVTLFTTRNGLPHDTVSSIVEDREGSIWLACLRGGIAQFDMTGTAPVVAHPVAETMTRSRTATTWWGRHRTLVRLEGTTCQDCLSFPTQILSILEDRQGRLWLGTTTNLWMFPDARTPASNAAKQIAENGKDHTFSAWNLHEDARGTIWMADQTHGLHRYDEKIGTMVRVPGAEAFGGCTNLVSDPECRIWLVGWDWRGAGFYDGTTVTRFTREEGLPSDCTTCAAVAPDGTVWVGTTKGLARFDGRRFRAFTEDEGLPSFFVQRLTFDSRGQLWIATLGDGVGRYDGRSFQTLTTDDGLPSNCVTGIIEDRDGSMLIATYRGVCRYVPDRKSVPEVSIDGIDADRTYVPGDKTCIPDSSPAVRFRFHGASLKTHRMRYTCILEGHEKEWRNTWSEEVRYEGLAPGVYTFRIIAINRDLVYSRTAAVATIEVVRDPRDEKLRRLEAEVQTLQGMLPICSVCKRIRNDESKWEQMETYISRRSNADFSHGYCPECAARLMDELDKFKHG